MTTLPNRILIANCLLINSAIFSTKLPNFHPHFDLVSKMCVSTFRDPTSPKARGGKVVSNVFCLPPQYRKDVIPSSGNFVILRLSLVFFTEEKKKNFLKLHFHKYFELDRSLTIFNFLFVFMSFFFSSILF